MVSQNFRQAYLQHVGMTQVSGDCDFLIFFSMAYCRPGKHRQVVLSNWYSLRHIILNQIIPSFSANNICNGPATWSILTSHYGQGSSPLQGHGSWLVCEVV